MTPSKDTLTTASCEDSRIAFSRFSRAGRESFKLNRLSEGGGAPRNRVSPAGERVGPAGKLVMRALSQSTAPPTYHAFSPTQRIEESWYATSKPLGSIVGGRTDWSIRKGVAAESGLI